MTLDRWKEQGVITAEQHTLLGRLLCNNPCSVFLELNFLLYAGVLAFAGGLTWTVQSYSRQLGDLAILAVLTGLLAGCLWYCFSRALAWSRMEVASPNLAFDYVLYLGCLTWSCELAYLEARLNVLSGQWDIYLLATACLFLALAYRFDNRLVLSLALSSLAGWFGFRTSHWLGEEASSYRELGIAYSVVTGLAGVTSQRLGIKAHFFGTYLNLAANVLFVAVLSGVFEHEGYWIWFLLVLLACGASLAYGLPRRQFSFVAYAAVYGYIAISAVLLRGVDDGTAIAAWFTFTGIGMLALLVWMWRRFGRDE